MAFWVWFFAFLVFWKSLLSQKLRMWSFGELILSITADMLQHSPHSSAEEETFRTVDYCIQHAVLNLKYHTPPTNSLEIFFRRDYQISLNVLSAGGTMEYHEVEYTKGPMIKYITTTHYCLFMCFVCNTSPILQVLLLLTVILPVPVIFQWQLLKKLFY